MQDTTIDRIFDRLAAGINRDRLVALTCELVRIPSQNPFDGEPAPGRREQEIADFYHCQLSDLGLETGLREVSPGRPNVWGRLRGEGNGATLMLSGHLDTVGTEGYDNPFRATVKAGRVYGRGSCDMKAALAAYLEVARVLKESDIRLSGDLLITGVADEEYQMTGSRDFGANGPWADFCVIGEPSSLQVCPAHKGQFSLFIRTFGKAVHSSIPGEGINAIEKMSKVIEAFGDYNDSLARGCRHELCGHGSFSPGVIRGGDIVSTVPDFCEMEVDRRTLPSESGGQVVEEYRRRLEAIRERDPEFRYEISAPSWDVGAIDTPLDNPVVKAVTGSYRQITGDAADITAFPGGTDAPNFGCPAVICGPGSVAQAHTLEEYVEIEEIVTAAKLYLRTALELLLPARGQPL